MSNFYEKKIYFALEYNGHYTFILEPDKWDKINLHLLRKAQDYGFWSDFIEDKYGMLFTFIEDSGIKGGAKILKDIYENDGSESIVYFEVGYLNVKSKEPINKWRINLNTYVCDFGGVSASIEKMPFQSKLLSRQSSQHTINSYSTVDGDLLNPISEWQLRLHSKTLSKTSLAETNVYQISNEYYDNLGNKYVTLITPDQSNMQISELDKVFTQPMELVNTGNSSPGNGFDCPLFTDSISNYTSSTSGLLKINYSGSFIIYAFNNSAKSGVYGDTTGLPTANQFVFKVTPRVVIQRVVSGIRSIVATYDGSEIHVDSNISFFQYPCAKLAGTFPSVTGAYQVLHFNRFGDTAHPISFFEQFDNIQIKQNDEIYVQLKIEPLQYSDGVFTFGIFDYLNTIRYTQLTTTPSSTCVGYRIIDVLNQMVENMTGQKDAVKSKYFSKGGPGYNFLITNGYAIRNFGADMHKPVKSFQSLVNDLQAIFCTGQGIRKTNDVENFVIEYIPNFFEKRTILVIDDTFLWKDKHNSSVCYNKVKLGYSKFEGLNIVQQDEFCTTAEYLIQYLRLNNNELTKVSDTIASGYLIEEQRRNQFILNPGQSLTNDNDMFIIATNEPCIFNNISVTFNTDGTVFFGLSSMSFNYGDKFEVSNGPNSGVIYTIQSQLDSYPRIGADGYNVTPSPSSNVVVPIDKLFIYPPSPNQVFSERNQNFEICNGVIDPSTIYNGRISMKHILYNWAPVISVALSDIQASSNDYNVSQILTTLVRMNSMFTSKFVQDEQFKGNVKDLTTVEINKESVRKYKSSCSPIYSKTGSEFKARMSYDKIDLLRKALNGELDDISKDYGGVVAKDFDGVYWFVHINDIQYDFVKEIATFDVQKVNKAVI